MKNDQIPKTFDEIKENEIDVPKWQLNHLKKQIMAEVDEEINKEFNNFKIEDKAESQIQEIIKSIYTTLENKPKPDQFDCFYENHEIEEYTRKELIAEFIKNVLNEFSIENNDIQEIDEISIEKLQTQEGMDKGLKAIAQNVSEGDNSIERLQELIEEKYPELVDSNEEMSVEEYKAKQEKFIEEELIKSVYGLETSSEFEEYFDEFRAMNNNDIEDIAVDLNKKIDVGVDVWKLILYSTISPHSNKFKIRGMEKRASLHTMLIGDISTAKSGILNIVKDISPQAEEVSSMTEASFIGAYDNKNKEIEEGIVDRIIEGNMLVEEYDKLDTDQGLMRVVFDNSSISVNKGQDTKSFNTIPTSIIAGANPKEDFFIQGENMREQIPFKEGELSRFDITIPLINSKEDMEKLVNEMEFFGTTETQVDMGEIRQAMNQISTRVSQVNKLEFEETKGQRLSLPEQIKQAFISMQKELENSNRQELLIMRDMGTLMRFVNIIGKVNEPIENGKVKISEKTVKEAIAEFETLMDLRERLYTSDDRDKINSNTKDEIEQKLIELTSGNGKVKQNELKDKCLQAGIVNNKATFYNKVDALINEERAKYTDPDKQRYKELQPLAQRGVKQ